MLSLLLSSCAVTPPDVPVCTSLSISKGYCVNTISSTDFIIDDDNPYKGKTWWELRPTMIKLPVMSWVEIKKFIIKVCKKSKRCNGNNITSWDRTVEKIDSFYDKKAK